VASFAQSSTITSFEIREALRQTLRIVLADQLAPFYRRHYRLTGGAPSVRPSLKPVLNDRVILLDQIPLPGRTFCHRPPAHFLSL